MAYPSALIDLRDTLSKDSFIEALNDSEMELFICQKLPQTIDDAVRLALKYEAFTQGRPKRLSSAKTGVRMQYEDDFQDMISQNDIAEIKNDICELKTTPKLQPSNGKPIQKNKYACFGCGQTDHLLRSCPYRDNADNSVRYNDNRQHQNCSGQRNVAGGACRDFQQNNQSTERPSVTNSNHFQQNSRQTRNQGNYKELTQQVRLQL